MAGIDPTLQMKAMITEANHISRIVDPFIDLTPGYRYSIYYSLVETSSLKWPFDTNCRDYSKQDERDKSKGECLYYCLRYRFHLNLQCLPSYFMGFKERDLNDSSQRIAICNDRHNYALCLRIDSHCGRMIDVYVHCMSECQTECHKIEYESEVKQLPIEEFPDQTVVTITSRFGTHKKQTVEPVISTQKLFADLGGLGGLWIGFNVLMIFKSVSKLFRK